MDNTKNGFTPRSIESTTRNWGILGRVDPSVFIISAIICIGFTVWGVIDNEGLGTVVGNALTWSIDTLGWLYMSAVFFFVVFVLFMAFSRYGKVRFGTAEDKPEYKNFSWFSMLFGCGMGVGLIFWSVAEPMYHYLSGPTYAGKPGSTQAAEWSLAISFFHWGISAWAVFVVVGIAMGIIIHKKGLPALISSCFYPVLGDRIYGPIGKAIDIITLVATFFGMCTTIGLGTMQLASGLHWNWDSIPINNTTYFIVLAVVTAGYLASATLPIEKGIKTGSNASMIATLGLMAFLVIVGPTTFIFNNFFNATGIYLQNFPTMSLWLDPVAKTGWLGSWTIFYWAWWIAWAPFVGIFIAKISKGRSVREFVLAALIAPTLFSMVFFSIFGSSAIAQHLDKATGGVLYAAIQADVSSAIFVMFEKYPLSGVVGIVLLFVVYTFFVVSADSCTIVLGMLSSGGNEDPKTAIKLLWGVAMAVSAGVLLAMSGLAALQTASIVAALAFTVIMLFLAYSTVRMVRVDYAHELESGSVQTYVPVAPTVAPADQGQQPG